MNMSSKLDKNDIEERMIKNTHFLVEKQYKNLST